MPIMELQLAEDEAQQVCALVVAAALAEQQLAGLAGQTGEERRSKPSYAQRSNCSRAICVLLCRVPGSSRSLTLLCGTCDEAYWLLFNMLRPRS